MPTQPLKVYIVGGAMRDTLLDQPVQDKDFVVVGSTPEQMLEAGFTQVGADFPVFLHPDSKAEYALARTERKSGKGYQGFSVHASPEVTLEEDLARRDLTINAMAQQVVGLFDDTPVDDEIIDPYGGQTDLKNGVLRHVSEAFCEDPLRVLRLARFYGRFSGASYSQNFQIADGTVALVKQMIEAGELEHLTPERVWTETARALMQEAPFAYIQCLQNLGALAVLMPTLAPVIKNQVTAQTLNDRLQKLTRIKSPLEVRWAGLMLGFALAHSTGGNALPHLEESALTDWLENIKSLSNRLKLPNKISKFSELVIASYPHALAFSGNDSDNQAYHIASLIQMSKADKDRSQLLNLLRLFIIYGLSIDEDEFEKAIDAYSHVTIIDIDASLKGAEIGEALWQKRIERIEHSLN